MSGGLRLRATVHLPPGRPGAFDHGDTDPISGRVFVAHTAFGTVEVIDAETLEPAGRIDACPEGSGVLCAPERHLVFAAARGQGKVLVIEPDRLEVLLEIDVGPRPNGLAWDGRRGHLLVADVDPSDQTARLIEVSSGRTVSTTPLPGRPRWCVYEPTYDRFLINIREPAAVAVLPAGGPPISALWGVEAHGPHGLDLDRQSGRAFVACDGAFVIALDINSGRETGRTGISGEPDAIWFNALTRRLYVAVGASGRIDVVDTERMFLAEFVATEVGAKTTAFDNDRQRLYVFLPRTCAAAVYEDA